MTMLIGSRDGKPYCNKCFEFLTDVVAHLHMHGVGPGKVNTTVKVPSADARRMEEESQKLYSQHNDECKCGNPNGTMSHGFFVDALNAWWVEYTRLQNEGKL